MSQNVPNKKLTPRQAKALEAIMSEPTLQAAAQKVGVDRRTLYRWMVEPAFAEGLRGMRDQAFNRTMDALADAAELAANVLREILGDDKAAAISFAAIRIRAARSALDGMFKARVLIETEERLQRIEEQMESILEAKKK